MNKETLQNYNGRLANNNTSLDNVLDLINDLPEVSGTLTITENGEHNVKEYEKVIADVHEPTKYKPKFISFRENSLEDLTEETRNLDTSLITNMSYMFGDATSLKHIDLRGWDTSNVTDMSYMFYYCGVETLDLSNFDTSKVTTMTYMFRNMQVIKSLDLSNLNLSNVTIFTAFASFCPKLETVKLPNCDYSKVSASNTMFSGCSNLNTLILGGTTVFPMTNISMLNNTGIANGTGYVYVPDNLVDSYKSANNWSTYASQIKGVSELV